MYSSVNLSFKTFEASMGYLWNYDKKCSIEKGYCNEWYNEPWFFLQMKRDYSFELIETSVASKYVPLISITFYNK